MDDALAIDGHAGALVIAGRLGSVHIFITARAWRPVHRCGSVGPLPFGYGRVGSRRRGSHTPALLGDRAADRAGAGVVHGARGGEHRRRQGSAAAAAVCRICKGGSVIEDFSRRRRQPAILVVSRRDEAPLTPADLAAAESARQRVLSRAALPPAHRRSLHRMAALRSRPFPLRRIFLDLRLATRSSRSATPRQLEPRTNLRCK